MGRWKRIGLAVSRLESASLEGTDDGNENEDVLDRETREISEECSKRGDDGGEEHGRQLVSRSGPV